MGLVLSFTKKKKIQEAYSAADELKVIIYNKSDFEFAEGQAERLDPTASYFYSPVERPDKMISLMVHYALAHPHWKVSLQTHKYLNIP